MSILCFNELYFDTVKDDSTGQALQDLRQEKEKRPKECCGGRKEQNYRVIKDKFTSGDGVCEGRRTVPPSAPGCSQ